MTANIWYHESLVRAALSVQTKICKLLDEFRQFLGAAGGERRRERGRKRGRGDEAGE